MAFVSRLPPSSSSLIQSTKPTSFGIRPVFTVHCVFNSQKASPFTEKHSIERYQRDSWVYKSQQQQQPSCSCPPPSDDEFFRDYDIALQLPELKKLLQVLREKREFENGSERKIGNVFLVGTGPGDPDLLTLKALRVIESADLLLYDRLVSNEVLNLVGPDAKLLYVGKTAGYHSRTQQEEIHELLLSFAEAGASVVRLKGGDPLASFLKICLTYNLYTFSMYSEGAERRWTFYNNKELRSKSF